VQEVLVPVHTSGSKKAMQQYGEDVKGFVPKMLCLPQKTVFGSKAKDPASHFSL
jgi:hypothetical protein